MCGRIGQFSAWQSYIEALALFRDAASSIEENRPRFNVGPGTKILTIYPDGIIRYVWWGFRPHWAIARKVPQMINARADKITGSAWKPMLKSGRVIIPCDSWYEWVKDDDGKKQPYLLHAKDKGSLFLAGLTNVKDEDSSGPRNAGKPQVSLMVRLSLLMHPMRAWWTSTIVARWPCPQLTHNFG